MNCCLYKKAGNYKTKEYFLRLDLKYRKKTEYDLKTLDSRYRSKAIAAVFRSFMGKTGPFLLTRGLSYGRLYLSM